MVGLLVFFLFIEPCKCTQRLTLKKKNQQNNHATPNPSALELCGIKVIGGARTPSNRQAPDSWWPLWPGAWHSLPPCSPIPAVCLHLSPQSAFIHPRLHQKGAEGPSCHKARLFLERLRSSPRSSYRQAACAAAVFLRHGVTSRSPETK